MSALRSAVLAAAIAGGLLGVGMPGESGVAWGSGTVPAEASRAGGVRRGQPATHVRSAVALTRRWGLAGHMLSAEAAAARLPDSMPAFFRNSAAQLAYLNPEPDRWRAQGDTALARANAPEHFLDLERVPPGALAAPDRYTFLDSVRAAGQTAYAVGLLPYRIVELTQRLRLEFGLWRAAPDSQTRAWVEERIVNDAGLLGHYVADGANPAHTTVNYNGWVGANPNGYATDRSFHRRFESDYVETHVALADIIPGVDTAARVIASPPAAVRAYIQSSYARVEPLYQVDRAARFDSLTTAPANRAFAVERLAVGATMLRDLWWTAWVASADSAAAER